MLITLIPLFDKDMAVKAYSVFVQKNNPFLNPLSMMTGLNDGAATIPGFEIIKTMGIETIAAECKVFVPITNVSIFSDISEQCAGIPQDRIVLLIDRAFPPVDMYSQRIAELKKSGFSFGVRGLNVADFMDYASILQQMDYVFLDNKKIVIEKAKVFFSKLYPLAKLVAGNIESQDIFESLKKTGGYDFYEGEFYRLPVTVGEHEISAIKTTYLNLLKVINAPDFELQEAADIIGRDPALTLSLLQMVNRVVKTAQITSIRHAAAMLGQRELKKWINTVVTEELYSDNPGELTRISLLRARFAENLAGVFGLSLFNEELFMMGLFSVLDAILEKPIEEALEMIQVSDRIKKALVQKEGELAPIYDFILRYEAADWQEISRILVIRDIDMDKIYDAYMEALEWYRMTLKG